MNQPHKKKVIIKRYQNRKLYDTMNSTYVTLDDIGNIVRRGDDVKVIDNKSKEDLTSVTLTQIIFEEEKKRKSKLPLAALKKIIRGGGDAIHDLVNKTTDNVSSGISNVKEGTEKIYTKFFDEISTEEKFLKGVIQKAQDLSSNIEGKIKSTVDTVTHVGVLKNEVKKLRQRIHYLEKKLKIYEKKLRLNLIHKCQ